MILSKLIREQGLFNIGGNISAGVLNLNIFPPYTCSNKVPSGITIQPKNYYGTQPCIPRQSSEPPTTIAVLFPVGFHGCPDDNRLHPDK